MILDLMTLGVTFIIMMGVIFMIPFGLTVFSLIFGIRGAIKAFKEEWAKPYKSANTLDRYGVIVLKNPSTAPEDLD